MPKRIIIPGLVETHFHGAMGETLDALTEKTFKTFSHFFATKGVTTFVPGLSSNSDKTVDEFLIKSFDYMKTKYIGAKMPGVYLEGPFISYKRKGSHNPDMLQKPSAEKIKRWHELSGGIIKKMIMYLF